MFFHRENLRSSPVGLLAVHFTCDRAVQYFVVTVVKWLQDVGVVWSNLSSCTGRDGTEILTASLFSSLRRITFLKQLSFFKWESSGCSLWPYCQDLVIDVANISGMFHFSLFACTNHIGSQHHVAKWQNVLWQLTTEFHNPVAQKPSF